MGTPEQQARILASAAELNAAINDSQRLSLKIMESDIRNLHMILELERRGEDIRGFESDRDLLIKRILKVALGMTESQAQRRLAGIPR